MKNICFQMNRKAWLSLIAVLCLAFPALAQKITVTGTVLEPEGEPAIGVSVTVQGQTGYGVSTDIDGNYRIEVAPDAVLVFSYVGYEAQTIPVNGRTTIDVTLVTNSELLDEVVVVGYGTVKKADATGSVAVIKPDDIQAGLATSANDLLVGASPGVVVTTDGGNPSGGAAIRIRGGASLNASNDPLVVVDGVPMNGSYGAMSPLTMIAPENIESMTILKSASATAIYGSRASNGVIIITTKKGQQGRPQVTFSANFHMATPARKWDMLDGNQFTEKIRQYANNDHALGLLGDANTDWQDEIYRTSVSQEYNLGVGGKVGFLPYRVNVSYSGNNGIIKTSNVDRTTVGFNLSPKFFDNLLSINVNVKGSYINQRNPEMGAIYSALSYNPTLPVYTDYATTGNLGAPIYGGYTSLINQDGNLETNGSLNPVAQLMGRKATEKSWSSTGNIQIDYALHFLPDLHLNLNLGYDVIKGESFTDIYANTPQAWNGNYRNGAASNSYNYQLSRNTMLEFYLNYKKEVEAIKSNFDVMAGYTWQRFDFMNHNYSRITSIGYNKQYDLATNSWVVNEDPASADNIGYGYGDTEEARTRIYRDGNKLMLLSFYGRFNYSFDDTYLLTFTLRDDATSRFSPDTRWGLFPALALGWKINNMPFFEDFTGTWDEFKLRAEWGVTGQQAVGSYNNYTPAYSISVPSAYYPSYSAGIAAPWINPLYPNAYDENLKWEETTTWNVGVDMAWLNNRIAVAADWYLRDTKDLLATVPVPAGMTTTNSMTRNIGTLRNIGVEFNVTARPVVTKDFSWTLGYNIGWNKNKITALTGSADEDKSFTLDAEGNPASTSAGPIQVHKVGYPANSFYVLEQVYGPDGNPLEGVYVDQNGDGKIGNEDLIINHSRDPKVTMTLSNTFNYKNWDFGITLRASLGNYVYNAMRARMMNLSGLEGQGNILHNVIDSDFYFTSATGTTNLVRSDYFVENASFLRCDNITVGYTWDNLFRDSLRLRLFGAVQNPFVITKYSGLDPEVFSGVDNNAYPRPLTVSLGVVASF